MKPDLVAHRPPMMPSSANRFPHAVASAVRWLSAQPPGQMVGDDAVGWWLLMELGRYPPAKVLEVLASRLNAISKGAPLPAGTLYTFTAIARTLNRAGYSLGRFPTLQQTWKKTVDRVAEAPNDVSFIWLIQMAAELWPKTAALYEKRLRDVAMTKDSKLMIPASAVVILHSLGFDVTKEQGRNIATLLTNARATGVIDEIPDWHTAYVLWALLACRESGLAEELGARLLERQKEGAWDESSEESVESTSICGLAILDMGASQVQSPDWNTARSSVLREVMLLLDNHNWLISNWAALQKMPKGQAKGPALEQFVDAWTRLDEGLSTFGRDVRTGTGEIDLVFDMSKSVPLNSTLKNSQFVLVECKNTSDPIQARDVRVFRDLLRERRKDSVQLGVMVSVGGYTGEAKRLSSEGTGDEQLVLLLDKETVEEGLRRRVQFSDLVSEQLQDRIVRRP